jgi:hypothetical protein
MSIHTRVISITAGLALAGAASGAVSGVTAIEAAALIFMRAFAPVVTDRRGRIESLS